MHEIKIDRTYEDKYRSKSEALLQISWLLPRQELILQMQYNEIIVYHIVNNLDVPLFKDICLEILNKKLSVNWSPMHTLRTKLYHLQKDNKEISDKLQWHPARVNGNVFTDFD